mmetsp:Transcript_132309/g.282929  ORF Transcript_132309/g.282929 Transcript_132309/m.282929 type:complete len:286 (-) Transcript_132309:2169-3026(-)
MEGAAHRCAHPLEDEHQDQSVDDADEELYEEALTEVGEVGSAQCADEEHHAASRRQRHLEQLFAHGLRQSTLDGDHDEIEADDEQDGVGTEEVAVSEFPHHHQRQDQQHAHEDEVASFPPDRDLADELLLLCGYWHALSVQQWRGLLQEELLLDFAQPGYDHPAPRHQHEDPSDEEASPCTAVATPLRLLDVGVPELPRLVGARDSRGHIDTLHEGDLDDGAESHDRDGCRNHTLDRPPEHELVAFDESEWRRGGPPREAAQYAPRDEREEDRAEADHTEEERID